MKTKEFIEKVEAMGYLTKIINNLTFVFDSNNNTVLSISNDRQYGIDCDYNAPATPELFLIAVEHAKTPIEERKSAKKYFIHVFRSQQDGYLTLVNDKAEFGSRLEATGFSIKTRFTKKEIRQLKKREDIPLDWEKITLAEAN